MIPGLLRTLFWLVLAWTVFRFLDRTFGGGRRTGSASGGGTGAGGRTGGATGSSSAGPSRQAAKDDHLGEYVDYEEVDADE